MTPGELPKGWRVVDFGSLISDAQNGCGKRSGQGRPTVVLRLADVSIEGRIATERLRSIGLSDQERAKYALKAGDLLAFRVNGSRSIVGRVISYTGPEGYAYCDHFIRFRLDEGAIDSPFAALAFQEPRVRAEVEARMVSSAGQNTVSQARLREIPLPLPPLAQQKRIVAAVDALRARVRVAQERLTRVRQILIRFRESVLAAACSGRLTEGWRRANGSHNDSEDPTAPTGQLASETPLPDIDIPPGWAWASTASICDPSRALTYGVIKLGPPVDQGVPTIRSSDVRPLTILSDDIKRIDPRIESEYGRTRLRGGEVLVTVRGTLGGIAVVPSTMVGFNVSREVAVLPVASQVDPRYVMYALATRSSQRWLAERARGVAYTGINIEDLRLLPLPLPSRKEQCEIVARVDRLLGLVGSPEMRLSTAEALSERAVRSTLAKAFAGELLPDGPEPGAWPLNTECPS